MKNLLFKNISYITLAASLLLIVQPSSAMQPSGHGSSKSSSLIWSLTSSFVFSRVLFGNFYELLIHSYGPLFAEHGSQTVDSPPTSTAQPNYAPRDTTDPGDTEEPVQSSAVARVRLSRDELLAKFKDGLIGKLLDERTIYFDVSDVDFLFDMSINLRYIGMSKWDIIRDLFVEVHGLKAKMPLGFAFETMRREIADYLRSSNPMLQQGVFDIRFISQEAFESNALTEILAEATKSPAQDRVAVIVCNAKHFHAVFIDKGNKVVFFTEEPPYDIGKKPKGFEDFAFFVSTWERQRDSDSCSSFAIFDSLWFGEMGGRLAPALLKLATPESLVLYPKVIALKDGVFYLVRPPAELLPPTQSEFALRAQALFVNWPENKEKIETRINFYSQSIDESSRKLLRELMDYLQRETEAVKASRWATRASIEWGEALKSNSRIILRFEAKIIQPMFLDTLDQGEQRSFNSFLGHVLRSNPELRTLQEEIVRLMTDLNQFETYVAIVAMPFDLSSLFLTNAAAGAPITEAIWWAGSSVRRRVNIFIEIEKRKMLRMLAGLETGNSKQKNH